MPLYKVWSADRKNRQSVVASTVKELLAKGIIKLGITCQHCCVVDESDGTVIDDDEVLAEMKGHVLLLLADNESWSAESAVSVSLVNSITSDNSRQPSHSADFLPANDGSTADLVKLVSVNEKYESSDSRHHVDLTEREAAFSELQQLLTNRNDREIISNIPERSVEKNCQLTASEQQIQKPLTTETKLSLERHTAEDSSSELHDMQTGLQPEFKIATAAAKLMAPGTVDNIDADMETDSDEHKPLQGFVSSNVIARTCSAHSDAMLPSIITSLGEFKQICACIVGNGQIPNAFMEVLTKTCIENHQLYQQLICIGAAMFWNPQNNSFLHSWDLQTLREVLSLIDIYLDKNITSINTICFESLDSIDLSIRQQRLPDSASTITRGNVCLTSVLGSLPPTVHQWDYYKIRPIVSEPDLKATEREGFVGKVLPYLLQRIKMRGCGVMHASRIAALVKTSVIATGQFERRKFHSKAVGKPSAVLAEDNCVIPISRLDCMTGLLNSVDEIVACDLLLILSQFPMALPLVMRSLEDKRYILTIPLLRGIVLKWESGSGRIVEHSLFNDPFRLIVAVRLGDNIVGKSTILNQMLTKENTFSSKAEPGSEYGKPASLDGSVEFVWLTQEVCKDALWNVLSSFYSMERNEVALLANMHGNAIDYAFILDMLSGNFSCQFIAFVMPNCREDNWQEFISHIGSEDRVCVIHVDPYNYDPLNPTEIHTGQLTADATLRKVRESISISLNECSSQSTHTDLDTGSPRLSLALTTTTTVSQTLVDMVKRSTCANIKQIMELQIKRPNPETVQIILAQNRQLNKLLDMLTKMFILPQIDLERAVIHLEKGLSRLSTAESQKARADLCKRKTDMQQALAKEKSDKDDILRLQKLIADAIKEIDKSNLGLEHFIREVAQIYEYNLKTKENVDVLRIPDHIVHMFIAGHPLELFDGDAEDIPMGWFNAVCKRVTREYPNFKVYVVSIIGLQSSGKSTLLNSLFACRFAVSVGRCSRGLFMRLLFLEKKLVEELKCDAILLIDTEGLGSPEKMNVAAADKKDRLLAAFAMGISNLTIINVLGEYIKELTEILQIAIVTMTRLEQADISPDILMVQHLLTEKNTDRTMEGQGQFCEAIRTAIDLAEKKEVQVGVRNAKCLTVLFERVQNGTLLSQFHPYKDGATANSPPSEAYHKDVVELYEKILDSCRSSKTIIEFKKWQSLVESYWDCVTKEDFALRFKNVKEIYEFIELGKRIETVKLAINAAFSFHAKTAKTQVLVKTAEMSSDSSVSRKNTKESIQKYIEEQISGIPSSCINKCGVCSEAVKQQCTLYSDIEGKPCELDVKVTITDYQKRLYESQKRKLLHILDAAIVQNGCSAEFDTIIMRHLKEELSRRKAGNYSDEERRQITNRILQTLQELVKQKSEDESVWHKIKREITTVYQATPDMVQKLESQLNVSFDEIFKLHDKNWMNRVFRGIKNIFNNQEQHYRDIMLLKDDLTELPNEIIKQGSADCFEEGMVAQLCGAVNDKLEKFCARNHKLQPEVRPHIHIWVLQQFRQQMELLQMDWDKRNKASCILQENKERYRQDIDTRLRYGFTCAYECTVIAQLLWTEIHRRAVSAENLQRIQAVKGLVWTTNSEHVRLKYFKQLAEEVQRGDKVRALRHFASPKEEIEKWFKREIDSFTGDNYGLTFAKTLDSEFQSTQNKIGVAENIGELISTVQSYVKESGEGSYYNPTVDMSKVSGDEFEVLKCTIKDSLQDSRSQAAGPVSISFAVPSTDDDVMARLGCTHRCSWCGALCWGERGHESNKGETNKHHASHQPNGLIGVRNSRTKNLVSESCHDTDENCVVSFGKYTVEDKILWKNAKVEHFSDWKFDSHYISKFDELMRWFFQELNVDIAKSLTNANPPSRDDLEKHKCCSLVISTILPRVEQEIS